jgi:hypothetical protein
VIKRPELNRLVVACLTTNHSQRAIEIYEEIRHNDPVIFRHEKVKSFRSFVKILNQFDEIKQQGTGIKVYTIRKTYITTK